MRFFILEAL